MKKKILTLLSVTLLLFSNQTVTARNFYVSTTGSDSNFGTEKSPFKTIKKAADQMSAGDVCYIMAGTYHEVLNPQKSGTEKNPITFKPYNDDKVVIDATESINGWVKCSGNMYKAEKEMVKSTSIYNTLFYDNELLDIARWPNNTDGDKFTFDGHRITGGSGSHFEVEGLPTDIDFTGGYFCYLGAHSGTSWSRVINSYRNGNIHFNEVNIKKWPYTPHNPTILRNGNRGQLYLFGKKELLDCPGEWYYDVDQKTIYAIFPEGKAPKANSVKGGVRATTIELNTDYIHVDGIDCFGGEVRVFGNHCSLSNGEFKNCAVTYDGLINISAQSATATFMVKGSDVTIENNLIEGGMANAIVLSGRGAKNHLIHNNVIRYFNTMGIHSKPISSSCEHTVITHNTIYTCGRDGITTSGQHSVIAYNDVSDCMRINNDGGVYYTVGNDDLKYTEIHHNYFHDSYGPEYADGRAAGIYLDNNSKGYDVHHNIVWNITWSGIMFNWYNTDFNLYNNTIWDAGYNMGRWANGYTYERINVINNYANVTSRDVIEGTGDKAVWIGDSIVANIVDQNSPFVDADHQNFIPTQDACLVDKGVVVKGLSQEYLGKKPDVGAYEYGEKSWRVGASWAKDVVGDDLDYSKQSRKPYVEPGLKESEDDIFKVMIENK